MMDKSEKIGKLTCEIARMCYKKDAYFAARFNLSPTEIKLLRLFEDTEKVQIKYATEELMLTPGRITHILDSLEKKKLVQRKNDEQDKRNIWIHLNTKSLPFIQNLKENRKKLHETILSSVSEDKHEQIVHSLEELLNALKKWQSELESA